MSSFFGVQKTPATDTRAAFVGKYASDELNTNTSNVILDDFRLFNSSLDTQKQQLVYYGQSLISGLAPTNLRVSSISGTSAFIQYTANQNATSYEIRTVPETSTWTTTDISYVLTGLTEFVPYTIYVFGVQADGKRGAAASVSILEPPDNISISVSTTNTSVGFQYNPVFGANRYQIDTVPATSSKLTTSTNTTLSGLNADISYTVFVYARDAVGGISQTVSRKITW